jgi:hypothetical protein
MQRIEPILHGGKEIIRFDFQGLEEDDDVIEFLSDIEDYMSKNNKPSLLLTNITGVFFTPTVMRRVSAIGKGWQHLVLKDAIVGAVGVKKILMQVYSAVIEGRAKAFNSEKEAIAWLLE